jgi:hypothetical protein
MNIESLLSGDISYELRALSYEPFNIEFEASNSIVAMIKYFFIQIFSKNYFASPTIYSIYSR